ncbi:MAG: serine protease [Acidimicrobiales bacterium]
MADAVVRVQVTGCGGLRQQRATGVALGDGSLVATVAHTFTEAEAVEVRHGERTLGAQVVWLDADHDVALLGLTGGGVLPALPLGDAPDGAEVTVTTAAADAVAAKPATVLRHVDATLDGTGRRAALEIAAEIEAGDSGAPVTDDDGELIGIVFAASRDGDDRGWVVAAEELRDALARPHAPVALTCAT